MMNTQMAGMLGRLVRTGTLDVTDPDGGCHRFGDGSGEPVGIRFADQEAIRLILADPALKLGEMYMEGRLIVETGNVFDLLSLFKRNGLRHAASTGMKIRSLLQVLAYQARSRLPGNRNKQNVAHHYDLDARLFSLFLDDDWQYSCAYFEPPDISLGDAQLAKKRHIAAKLRPEAGHRILDVGSGWGGMAMYLAEATGASVTGITLSEEQATVSRARIAERGLGDRVRIDLVDYLTISGEYDRIVSVGMFEHININSYDKFFRKTAQVLHRQGVMVLHYIGRVKPARTVNPWIDKYIFPGGYMPALSEVLPAVERAGLLVKDIEVWPMHYAFTLRAWRERFVARWEEAVRLYDERFCRMWEFYLASSEASFRHDRLHVVQLQLARHQDAVPYARDYIVEAETGLKAFEAQRPPLAPVRF